MRRNEFWNFSFSFCVFISLCVIKHDFVKELGVWPYTIEANHGESPCVTMAHISGTWALCFSWILPPFWLFILSAWWPDTLRRQATEEWIASPPGRPWCLPGWRLPWHGDVWVSAVSGNWLEGIRGFLVQMILREAISCPGNKEEAGMEEGGPIIGFFSSLASWDEDGSCWSALFPPPRVGVLPMLLPGERAFLLLYLHLWFGPRRSLGALSGILRTHLLTHFLGMS